MGAAFNRSDAAKVASWLHAPCPYTGPPPPDPHCARGVESAGLRVPICCLASCGELAAQRSTPRPTDRHARSLNSHKHPARPDRRRAQEFARTRAPRARSGPEVGADAARATSRPQTTVVGCEARRV
jgi:hypothetical protein